MRLLPSAMVCALVTASASLFAAEPTIGDESEENEPAAEQDATQAHKAVPFDREWLEPYFAEGAARKAIAEFRAADFAAALRDFRSALSAKPTRSPERHQLRFLIALSHMDLSDWREAGDLFEALWTDYPVLAPYHAYYAARCRLRRGDAAGALEWVARVPGHTVPEAESLLVKIDALIAEKRWTEVENQAAAYLARFPQGPRRAEAMFRQAEAMLELKRPPDAVAPILRRIWAESPLDAWASRAEERLQSLAKSLTREKAIVLTRHSAEEWIARGMSFFDRNQNVQSEAAFNAALDAPDLDSARACVARFHRAQSVWKQRQRSRAAPLFAEAEASCRQAKNDDLVVRATYQDARCLASTGEREKAIALYARIESEYPTHRFADDARLRTAEVLADAGNTEGAEKYLHDLPDRYPSGDNVGEALWRLAFAAWRAGDFDKALSWLDENLRRIPRESVWYAEGRAHYWRGRIFERRDARELARQAYERAVREYPLSVYALLSLERLRQSFPEAHAALLQDLRLPPAGAKAKSPWTFGAQSIFGEPGFLRAVELARLGLGSDARRELARLGMALSDNHKENGGTKQAGAPASIASARDDVYWIAAILLDRSGQWSVSHSIPRHTLTGFRWSYPTTLRREGEWRLAYPRAFADIVSKHSRTNHVPEPLQFAIMREESAFSPRIESFANALGLTQLIIKTAQRFATGRITRDSLLEPAKNVEIGSRFLSYLLEHYGGALPLAIAGYNAGEAAVDRWLRERSDMELDEFLESIPYDETRNYTKRVLASVFAYSWLYYHEHPVPALSFSLSRPVPVENKFAGKKEIKPAPAKAPAGRNTPAKATQHKTPPKPAKGKPS